MPFPREKAYTTEDIYNLPEGIRAELVDGRIYYMSPPGRTHQKISAKLHTDIYQYIQGTKGKCEVYAAPFAVFLNNNDTNYFEPDISVICDTDKLDEKGCHGAPDWIIEIVSTTSRSMDYHRKLLRYSAAGVREYWIVDPLKNRITVYDFDNEETTEYTFADSVKAGIYKDLFIDFSQLNI